jgi:KDO2-lipid IV(A) lauroyltransferase
MQAFLTDLQFRIEWLVLRLVFGLMHLLPLDTAIRLSGAVWHAVAPHLRRHERALRHIEEAMPELPAAERERIITAMWRHLGMTFAESVLLDKLAREPDRIVLDPASRTMVEARIGQPLVFASLHTGNWEVASWAMLLCGVRFAGVYQQLRNPYVERYLLSMRAPFYPRGLVSKGKEAVRYLVRAMEDNEGAAMMADLRELRGVSVPVFGRMAPSTPFPATLVRSHHGSLLAGRVIRTGPGRFYVEGTEIPVPHTDNRRHDIEAATAALNARFEVWIREIPEQWMWAHRRFER